MAKRQLATYVYVNGERYGPGDELSSETADAITNPKAWGEQPDVDGPVVENALEPTVAPATAGETSEAPKPKTTKKATARKRAS